MILVIFGTTGELIKLMPVLVRLTRRRQAFLLVSTGQQVTQIPRLLELAGLPRSTSGWPRGRAAEIFVRAVTSRGGRQPSRGAMSAAMGRFDADCATEERDRWCSFTAIR